MPGFSGQGIVSIAPRLASGLPGIFRDFGNASVYEVGLTAEEVERKESMTGNRLPNRKMTKSRGGTLKMKGDEFNSANLALAIKASVQSVTAGVAVSGHVLPTGMVVGDVYALPTKMATAVTLKDSTAAPKTLVLDTDYTFDQLPSEIKILNLNGYVQPFKADFTPGAYQALGAFQDNNTEFFIRLKGINTDTGKRGICDCYRVKISPTKALALLNDDFLDWDLECTLLADLTRESADPGGQFFGFFAQSAF